MLAKKLLHLALFLFCFSSLPLFGRGRKLGLRRLQTEEADNENYEDGAEVEPESDEGEESYKEIDEDEAETDEEDSEEEDGEADVPEERECTITRKKDEVKFACKAKTEGSSTVKYEIEDEIVFKIKTSSSGLKIKVEYEQEIDTGTNETESETQYEILFESIIEYAKLNETFGVPDLAYEWDTDDILQMIYLTEWQDFSEISTDANGIVSSFNVSTMDGLVGFSFTLSRALVNQALTANKMKIDFGLTAFPWVGNGTTYVAMLSSIESKKKVEIEYEAVELEEDEDDSGTTSKKTKEVKIEFDETLGESGYAPFGEYTWADTAEVATMNDTSIVSTSRSMQIIQVVATSPTQADGDETSQYIAFSFVGDRASSADYIYWDPEAGIGYTNLGSTSTTTSDAFESGCFLLTAGSVAATLLLLIL